MTKIVDKDTYKITINRTGSGLTGEKTLHVEQDADILIIEIEEVES